jgi:AraC-like DNA-binding protein
MLFSFWRQSERPQPKYNINAICPKSMNRRFCIGIIGRATDLNDGNISYSQLNIWGYEVCSSRLIESTDPDEFFALVRPDCRKLTVTERGPFKARARLIEVGRLYAQRRSEFLTRVIHVHNPRPGILFLTEPGAPMFFNGAELGYKDILVCGRGATYISRLSGPAEWGAIALDGDVMEALCTSRLGNNPAPVNGFRIIRPPAAALARLRSLHASAASLMETAGEPLKHIACQRRLEQMLITTMLDSINVADVRPDTMGRQHHHMIISRFLDGLDAHPAEPLNMQNLSKEIGVSSRSFRTACQEQLGVSPTQYLLLRRMQLARRALRRADPALTRVTDIATELGFWELGRFAVKYHNIFGETPSTTLKAPASASLRPRSLDYALA